MNEIIVQVTQDHIDRAEHNAHFCPIALAIREQLGATDVAVFGPEALIDNKFYTTSKEVWEWVANFDIGDDPVEPITVTLTERESYNEDNFFIRFKKQSTNMVR